MVHVCSPHFWLGLWWISANAFIKFYRDSSDYKMIMMIIFMANLDNHLPSNRERMARQRLHLEPFHRSYFLPSWFIICCHDHMCCRVVDIIMITSVATVIHHLMPWSHLLPYRWYYHDPICCHLDSSFDAMITPVAIISS